MKIQELNYERIPTIEHARSGDAKLRMQLHRRMSWRPGYFAFLSIVFVEYSEQITRPCVWLVFKIMYSSIRSKIARAAAYYNLHSSRNGHLGEGAHNTSGLNQI